MTSADNLPISVNICTYNEEKYIEDCLKSVIKNNPKEIIVVDGGRLIPRCKFRINGSY